MCRLRQWPDQREGSEFDNVVAQKVEISVIFVLIYFLVLVLVLFFQLFIKIRFNFHHFFRFNFRLSFANYFLVLISF